MPTVLSPDFIGTALSEADLRYGAGTGSEPETPARPVSADTPYRIPGKRCTDLYP